MNKYFSMSGVFTYLVVLNKIVLFMTEFLCTYFCMNDYIREEGNAMPVTSWEELSDIGGSVTGRFSGPISAPVQMRRTSAIGRSLGRGRESVAPSPLGARRQSRRSGVGDASGSSRRNSLASEGGRGQRRHSALLIATQAGKITSGSGKKSDDRDKIIDAPTAMRRTFLRAMHASLAVASFSRNVSQGVQGREPSQQGGSSRGIGGGDYTATPMRSPRSINSTPGSRGEYLFFSSILVILYSIL